MGSGQNQNSDTELNWYEDITYQLINSYLKIFIENAREVSNLNNKLFRLLPAELIPKSLSPDKKHLYTKNLGSVVNTLQIDMHKLDPQEIAIILQYVKKSIYTNNLEVKQFSDRVGHLIAEEVVNRIFSYSELQKLIRKRNKMTFLLIRHQLYNHIKSQFNSRWIMNSYALISYDELSVDLFNLETFLKSLPKSNYFIGTGKRGYKLQQLFADIFELFASDFQRYYIDINTEQIIKSIYNPDQIKYSMDSLGFMNMALAELERYFSIPEIEEWTDFEIGNDGEISLINYLEES